MSEGIVARGFTSLGLAPKPCTRQEAPSASCPAPRDDAPPARTSGVTREGWVQRAGWAQPPLPPLPGRGWGWGMSSGCLPSRISSLGAQRLVRVSVLFLPGGSAYCCCLASASPLNGYWGEGVKTSSSWGWSPRSHAGLTLGRMQEVGRGGSG